MRAIWITAAIGAAACTGQGKPKEAPKAGDGGGAATVVVDAGAALAADAGVSGNASAPAPVKLEGPARGDLEAFVGRWLASQNTGNFAAYQAFYGDRFHGVRRSGKQIRRFDRAGWMRDRGAMFRRPMQVESADLVAYAQGDRRQLFFTQTWAQGSYKDVGTKSMIVTGTGDAIRIVYEELLQSNVQKPAAAPAAGAITDTRFGYDRAASVDAMRLARVEAGDVFLAITPREIAWIDPEVTEESTDAASGQVGAAIVEADVPAGDPLAALTGVAVTVLGEDLEPRCTGKLGAPRLRFAGFVDGADDEAAVIEQARTSHDLFVVAPLDAPCQGPFVRGARAGVVASPPNGELPDRAVRALRTWYDGTQEGDIWSAVNGKRGFVLVTVHTLDSCESQEARTWTLYRAEQVGRTWKFESAEDGEGEDEAIELLDLDGRGELDVLTKRGAYVDGTWQTWDPDLRLYWPAGLGCDGYDPEEEDTDGD